MENRTKILAAAVLVLLAGFVLDTFAFQPWSLAMANAARDVRQVKADLVTAEEKARKEPEVLKEWKALKDRLAAVKSEEAPNRLGSFVDQLIRKHDLKKSALSPEPAVAVAGSAAFREHFLAISFQCSWEAFVKLLLDLYTADEFVRVQRIGVQSHYLTDKESYLDVTLRLSTVSAVAGGGK
ncbi:MAG TPA: hypothetical protein VJU16_03480 [Planctomycetota bacterium]|nr:hypothetical protein [Planctomycetota bacterium]